VTEQRPLIIPSLPSMAVPEAVAAGDLPLRETSPVSAREQLVRISTVDALAGAIRDRIFQGELGPGDRLPERELTERYGVARHSVRAALRALAAEGLVEIEPNRGASVASLDAAGIRSLFELRTALELEAAHLALERHGGRLPQHVHEAARRLREVCSRPSPPWGDVARAHDNVHLALVRAAGSERIARAYEGLAGEMRLFVMALRPHWSLERMAAQHEQLVEQLEQAGPVALRDHLRAGRESVLGAQEGVVG
jgi:DNA-binding GntR family transcriptional regulator